MAIPITENHHCSNGTSLLKEWIKKYSNVPSTFAAFANKSPKLPCECFFFNKKKNNKLLDNDIIMCVIHVK